MYTLKIQGGTLKVNKTSEPNLEVFFSFIVHNKIHSLVFYSFNKKFIKKLIKLCKFNKYKIKYKFNISK